MSTALDPITRQGNEAFLARTDPSAHADLRKQAADGINDYTRRKIREEGFVRRILSPMTVSNDQLDRAVDTELPVKVIDFEPDSPGAVQIPFAALPPQRYTRGQKYRIMFARYVTGKYLKDVDTLRTYHADIRQIFSDNSIKDVMAAEDGAMLKSINTSIGAANSIVPETGTPQYVTIGGGVTRDTWTEAMTVLPKSVNHLSPATVLINNVTIWQIVKWGRDEIGGDFAQEHFKNGFTEKMIMGVRLLITNKRDLVPDNSIYMFAEEKFIGKLLILEDVTMAMKRDFYMLEFFAYETIGAAFVNVSAFGRVDFT